MESQFRLEGLMVDHLSQCRLDERDRPDFAEGIHHAGRFEPPPLVRGTIDELRSSGRMEILGDLALRRKISRVVRKQEQAAEVLGYIVDRATPELVYIDRHATLIQPPGEPGEIVDAQPPARVMFDFATLCHDPAYGDAVSAVQELTRVVIGHNQARLKDYRDLVTMINGELGQDC